MAVIKWNQTSEKKYQAGVSKGVLFPMNSTGAYEKGVAFNGLTKVAGSPSGGDANDIFADNIKWLSIRGDEQFGGSIGAFMYPDEFAECNGEKRFAGGVKLGQQTRKPFGLCYRTEVGNDTEGLDFGYQLHFVYHATINPTGEEYDTINESADPMEMSWDFDTIKEDINVKSKSGKDLKIKPASTITIDSTLLDEAGLQVLKTLEGIVYGTADTEPRLPSIAEILSMFDDDIQVDAVA